LRGRARILILSLTAKLREMTPTVNGQARFGLHFILYEELSSRASARFLHYLRVPASGYTLNVVLVPKPPLFPLPLRAKYSLTYALLPPSVCVLPHWSHLRKILKRIPFRTERVPVTRRYVDDQSSFRPRGHGDPCPLYRKRYCAVAGASPRPRPRSAWNLSVPRDSWSNRLSRSHPYRPHWQRFEELPQWGYTKFTQPTLSVPWRQNFP
jgi:hypothetical protein